MYIIFGILQKQSTWVTPSFDDFGDFGAACSQPVSSQTKSSIKRKRDVEVLSQPPPRSRQAPNTTDLWVDKYKPTSLVSPI